MFQTNCRIRCAAIALFVGIAAFGQPAGSDSTGSGPTLGIRLDGTHNVLGLITRIDTTAGYRFNRYLTIDAGLPVYIVRPSQQAVPVLNAASSSGIGNAHASIRLNFNRETFSYSPSLTLTAPTGSKEKGLSTGRFTWDWNNLFQRSFGRVTPYAAAGLANTVADTPFFVRPFTSEGLAAHVEGGAVFAFSRYAGVGGSVYAIEPSGEQTIVSRLGRRQAAGGSGMPDTRGQGRSRNNPPAPFETTPTTTGPATIARDRGASVWLTVTPSRPVDVQLGYSRSTTYALNTVFFGIGVDMGYLIRRK